MPGTHFSVQRYVDSRLRLSAVWVISLARKVGLFGRHIRNIQKKVSLQSKYKYIKNTMVTGIAQKATKLYFHCDPLIKKIY